MTFFSLSELSILCIEEKRPQRLDERHRSVIKIKRFYQRRGTKGIYNIYLKQLSILFITY